MVDWSELQAFRQQGEKEASARQAQNAALAAHMQAQHVVAVQMEEIIHSEPWETLSAHLQELLKMDREEKQAIVERIESGALLGVDLERANLKIQRIMGRIEARQQDLSLPHEVMDRDKKYDSPQEGG